MLSTTMLVMPSEGGFNPMDLAAGGNAVWTLVIFVVSLPFIWKVVMGPITHALEDRDERAARAITSAETASEEAEAARADVEVKLGEAKTEAANMLAVARERGEVREREIIDSARQEATQLLDNARRTIRSEQDKAIAAIRNEVVDLSLQAASKVLDRNVQSDDDRRIVADLVSQSVGSEAADPAGDAPSEA